MRDNEFNTLRGAPVSTQPPQASASTNSAIRAQVVNSDEECTKTDGESSAAAHGEKFPESEVVKDFRIAGAGHQTKIRRKPYPRKTTPDDERFWRRVVRGDGCWEWTGCIKRHGYGHFVAGRGDSERHMYAHRFSYELNVGPIPDGFYVCHRCDNRRCVRPDHLFVGTHKENQEDMSRKGRAGGAMLTPDQVRSIRRECPRPQRGAYAALAKKYGVGRQTIGDVVRRRSYAAITDEP